MSRVHMMSHAQLKAFLQTNLLPTSITEWWLCIMDSHPFTNNEKWFDQVMLSQPHWFRNLSSCFMPCINSNPLILFVKKINFYCPSSCSWYNLLLIQGIWENISICFIIRHEIKAKMSQQEKNKKIKKVLCVTVSGKK